VNLLYTKMADVSVPGFRKYWTQTLASLNSQCLAMTNRFPEAGSVVQVHKVLNDIGILAGCTPEKGGGEALCEPLLRIVRRRTEETFAKVRMRSHF
jgi:hypothetical protein